MAAVPKVDKGKALQAAVRWSWSIPQQYARLQDALNRLVLGQRESQIPRFGSAEHSRPYLEAATESHLLLVATHHLDTAVNLLELDAPAPDSDLGKLLRNVQEHWDDVGGPSLDRLLKLAPGSKPDQLVWRAGDDVKMGGLKLHEVDAWAKDVYRRTTGSDPWPVITADELRDGPGA